MYAENAQRLQGATEVYDKNNSFQSMPNHDLMEDITVNTLAPILITNAMAKINHHAHVIQCSDARLEQHLNTSFSYAISKQLLETYTRIAKKQFPPTFRINTQYRAQYCHLSIGHSRQNAGHTRSKGKFLRLLPR